MRIRTLVVAAILLLPAAIAQAEPSLPAATASPTSKAVPDRWIGLGLSVLVPGGGQFYRGDWVRGALLLAASAAAYGVALAAGRSQNSTLALGSGVALGVLTVASPLEYWWNQGATQQASRSAAIPSIPASGSWVLPR